ncbi:MAG: hypothetical protein R2831_06535 [Chitinophagaceae bacterium]
MIDSKNKSTFSQSNDTLITFPLLVPGTYLLRYWIDENENKVWDSGQFQLKKQPEKMVLISKEVNIKPNWENKLDIRKKEKPSLR